MGYCKIQSIREQCGFQYKERGENIGIGDGVNTIFYTNQKPIVDRTYSDTVTVADVKVYVNNLEVVVSAIDPEQGKLTLASAPANGAKVTCDYDWTNIEDTLLDKYHKEATSQIDSKISILYALPLNPVPDLIKLIEKKLTAGLLLDKEYSVGEEEAENTRGRRWIKWAEEKLQMIVDKNLLLLDATNEILPQKTAGTIKGWPDDTTATTSTEESGGDICFRIGKQF